MTLGIPAKNLSSKKYKDVMHHVWMCQESLINQVYLLHWSMLYTIGITEKDEWLQNHEVGQFFVVEVKKKTSKK